jgi:6,7-dimethyl-8-ribityllumazine synthase
MTLPAGTGQPAPASGQSIGAARIGIAVSDYHRDITSALLEGCRKTLLEHGASEENILILHAPGAFELPSVAQSIIERHRPDAVVCLGCVIKGDTRHDEYINHAIASGVMNLTLTYKLPVIFGVLTTENVAQAQERSGGTEGNKGVEAALAAVKMIGLK